MNTATALVVAAPAALESMTLSAEALRLAQKAVAENTKLAYAHDWASFSAWCHIAGVEALPASPETVCNYIAAKRIDGLKPKTVARHVSTITSRHLAAGLASPCAHIAVRAVLKGFRKECAAAPRQAEAMTVDVLRKVLPRGNDIRSIRDRALLLCGFFMAGRRSEIADRNVEDLRHHSRGILVYIATSKTDQEGKGTLAELPQRTDDLCPVRALTQWLEMASITTGPLFRGIRGNAVGTEALCDKQVCRIVKARVAEAGMAAAKFSGHSLRRGIATTAARAGAKSHQLCKLGRWTPDSRSAHGYIQEAEAFIDSAASLF